MTDFINQDDEDAILDMLGFIPDNVQEEYMVWLRMQHRAGMTGKLGIPSIVCLLRSLGYGPPPKGRSYNGTVVWRNVERAACVVVTITDKDGNQYDKIGKFFGIGNDGFLNIKFKDDPTTYEFPPKQVALGGEDLPADLDADSLMVEEEKEDVRLSLLEDAPEDHDEPFIDNVVMENDWGAVEKGDIVLFGEDSEQEEGQFVCVGPGDYEVTVLCDTGEEVTLPEAIVEIKDVSDA